MQRFMKSKMLIRYFLGIKKPGNDLLSHIECSTIGAGGLNDRVRDGNGCGPAAIATRLNNQKEYRAPVTDRLCLPSESHSLYKWNTLGVCESAG